MMAEGGTDGSREGAGTTGRTARRGDARGRVGRAGVAADTAAGGRGTTPGTPTGSGTARLGGGHGARASGTAAKRPGG